MTSRALEGRRVLIAGCGYVGVALAGALGARGAEVIALRRDVTKLPEALRHSAVAVDLDAEGALSQLPRNIDDVVYAASPGGGDDARYEATYVRHVGALLHYLGDRGDSVGRFVLTTSTGVYGQVDGEWVDERSETAPTHHSGLRMLEGERLVQGGPFQGVAVRLAGIYGPTRTSLVDRVRSGDARTPRAPLYTNRIHRDDCALVLLHALEVARAEPVYLGVDEDPAPLGDVQAFIARELGLPEPPLEDETNAAASGRRARSNKRCRSLFLRALRFRYPTYREGYRAMLSEMKASS